MKRKAISRLLFLTTVFLTCFLKVYSQQDSATFRYQEFLYNLVLYHPIAKQAELKLSYADAELLKARGGFDPKLYSDWSEKNFNNKLYYRQNVNKLRIPTPIGLDILGGYENTTGDFLNPENKTDVNGLWFLGVEVDILQGFLTNNRKTILNQARIFQQLANNEQQLLLNELIFNASYAYFQWQLFYHFDLVLHENLQLSKNYLDNTKQTFFGGEKTAMDTLEAHIWYKDASIEIQKNKAELIKSKLNLGNFLWFNDSPVTLSDGVIPEDYDTQILGYNKTWTDSLSILDNPNILASLNKLSMLEIEQKLKREMLKPKLKIKYNPLLYTSPASITPQFSVDNYNWGFVFSMPIFLRKERASIKQGKIKINELEYQVQDKRNELSNKIENVRQQQIILMDQKDQLQKNVNNYRALLEGENEKFLLGESSVFLLNKRQEKYISTRLKLINVHVKLQIEYLKYLYYTNQLIDD